MTNCRCGHGRHAHQVDQRRLREARRERRQPTMNLKCRYFAQCRCRNYVGPDGAIQGRWGRPLAGKGAAR